MRARSKKTCRSYGLSRFGTNALDHLTYAREVSRCHVTRGEEVGDERGDVARKETLGELAHHRMLYISFGYEGAIHELTVACSPGENSAALESGNDRGDCRLRQLSLVVQLLPDLRDRQLALIPEQAEDGDLELGQVLAIGHLIPLGLYECRFYTCRTGRVKRKFQSLSSGELQVAPRPARREHSRLQHVEQENRGIVLLCPHDVVGQQEERGNVVLPTG